MESGFGNARRLSQHGAAKLDRNTTLLPTTTPEAPPETTNIPALVHRSIRSQEKQMSSRITVHSHYVADEYVDPVYSDNSINVNAVCSTRSVRDQHSCEVEVDYHNGHSFRSSPWRFSSPEAAASKLDQLTRELRRVANSPGRAGMTPLPDAWREPGMPHDEGSASDTDPSPSERR